MAKKRVGTVLLDDETGEILASETMEAPIFWKTPYNHNRDAESLSTAQANHEPSKTQQHFAEDADINKILAKFQQTGELNTTGIPNYITQEQPFDLQDSMVTSWEVEQAWNALPAAVRNMLKDPMTFTRYVDHCLETGDLGPLQELGLAKIDTTPEKPTEKPQEPKKPESGGTPAPEPAKAPAAPAAGAT